ncbi:MAG TPA: NYN domain-containing protein [Candidatus Paceibacterota bacterium]|mgnify:CR=1 FL=1|nr:NYN domain-containing protein [Candidatus Paceibacterota bacterium]
MFHPKTGRIKKLSQKYPDRILELEKIFDKKTNIYIDFANVIRWQDKLKWRIDLKRLKQFLDSFSNIEKIKFYNGKLEGDEKSLAILEEAEKCGYIVKTKPVKIMQLSINVSSISPNSPEILKNFIRAPLLKKLKVEAIEFLNHQLKELNQQGILFVQDLKCNFDVEIGRDMLVDYEKNKIENFILWSGDSDFADPVNQLLEDGKKVVLFATVRRVASELNELQKKGLFIFDIQKIRNFICWKREILSS